jgi:hypothetical protein
LAIDWLYGKALPIQPMLAGRSAKQGVKRAAYLVDQPEKPGHGFRSRWDQTNRRKDSELLSVAEFESSGVVVTFFMAWSPARRSNAG